jgi:hypothetical protein
MNRTSTNPLKTKACLNYIERFGLYRAVNTFLLDYKTGHLTLCKKIFAVCYENHKKHSVNVLLMCTLWAEIGIFTRVHRIAKSDC